MQYLLNKEFPIQKRVSVCTFPKQISGLKIDNFSKFTRDVVIVNSGLNLGRIIYHTLTLNMLKLVLV